MTKELKKVENSKKGEIINKVENYLNEVKRVYNSQDLDLSWKYEIKEDLSGFDSYEIKMFRKDVDGEFKLISIMTNRKNFLKVLLSKKHIEDIKVKAFLGSRSSVVDSIFC
jgi:hypothetical protein